MRARSEVAIEEADQIHEAVRRRDEEWQVVEPVAVDPPQMIEPVTSPIVAKQTTPTTWAC